MHSKYSKALSLLLLVSISSLSFGQDDDSGDDGDDGDDDLWGPEDLSGYDFGGGDEDIGDLSLFGAGGDDSSLSDQPQPTVSINTAQYASLVTNTPYLESIAAIETDPAVQSSYLDFLSTNTETYDPFATGFLYPAASTDLPSSGLASATDALESGLGISSVATEASSAEFTGAAQTTSGFEGSFTTAESSFITSPSSTEAAKGTRGKESSAIATKTAAAKASNTKDSAAKASATAFKGAGSRPSTAVFGVGAALIGGMGVLGLVL